MSHSKPTRFTPPSTQSPCVRNCCLNQEDVCLGCGRTLEEIRGWSQFTTEERTLVLDKARERRRRFPTWTL
ncbi:MAG: DUF1289 domain-containing protein [Pseudomonadales bacterium]|nr:DUF1289 domain-containing protein [Pseudomonadales bacterium]RLU01734.1 MAG: DUF1289 domain-containing protein [Ketobacter sp.]